MKGFSLISICILIEFHCIFNDFLCIFNDFHGFFFDFHCILLRAFEARSCPPIRQLMQSKRGGRGRGGITTFILIWEKTHPNAYCTVIVFPISVALVLTRPSHPPGAQATSASKIPTPLCASTDGLVPRGGCPPRGGGDYYGIQST